MFPFTRRELLGLIAVPAVSSLQGQEVSGGGMASRHVKPSPRQKPSGLPFYASLTDVGKAAGLHAATISGHANRTDYVIEAMGCGVAFLDYDNDGWLDILVLSGSRFGDPPADASNRLYKNNRNGTFADVTTEAGLFRTGYWYGVTVGDYNNDGWEDIFITGWPRNALFRNNGNGTFTDVTEQAGLLTSEARFATGCTFVESQRNGRLDLFVSNYVAFEGKSKPRDSSLFVGPRGLPYGHHSFYRNNGDGTFSDATVAAGISKTAGGYGLTTVAADFNGDGWPDIYVACDSTPSLLFENQRDGTFAERAIERGVALSEDGMEQAGMGVAIGNIRSKDDLDILKTHYSSDRPALYINDGSGNFQNDELRCGLGVETRFVTWGVGIEDLDNDGNPDIFWVTGGLYPELASDVGEFYKGPRVLFRNQGGGKFEELMDGAGPALQAVHCSRGCAFGDFDNDGDVDVVIINQNEPPSLLRNDVSGGGHWVKVLLRGVRSNRSAIGSRVTVRYGDKQQVREVLGQCSYLSVNDKRLHFGLGAVAGVEIEVRWPSGSVEKFSNVAADRSIEITEGAGITKAQRFGSGG